MICVSPSELKIIIDIFKKHIPRGEVRAFGSRYKWTCKDYSDLDIAIDIGRPMTTKELGAIEEDFIESDLPYRVDVLDYNSISKEFQTVIDKGCEVVYRELGWEKVRLGDVCEIIGGGTPKTTNNDFWNGNIPWISIVDFNNGSRKIYETKKTITKMGLEKSSTKMLNVNDIIISARGTVGALAQLGTPMAFNQSCYGLRGKGKVENDFLYYSLKNIIQIIKKNTHGSVFDTITRNTMVEVEIYLPNIQSQQAIATTLSCLDDKIELNNRINKNLEAQAQAIFKSWFVDFEPFLEGEFEDSELGKIPKGWRVGRLGEIATITMGQSPKGDTYNENGEGTVFYQGRAEFGTRFPKCRLFTTAPNRMANENDILLSVRAPVGDYNIATESCCIGRGLAAIKPLNQTYSYCICLMSELQPKFNQFNAEGTVFGSINKDSLNGICVIIPDDSILLKFEKLGSSLNDQIRSNYNNTQILATLRDTLLPKLMSGELLPDSLRKLEDSPCL